MVQVQQRVRIAWLAGLFLAIVAAYSNHFGNGFHFDDSHTVVENPAIRSLAAIPHFFTDARTFSHEPAAQTYRPLVTASLALDYALGGGLNLFWFHLSTFFWFLVQLSLMYAMLMNVLERTSLGPQNYWIAWFAIALYGLHPSSAETVNYIIQRGDLYVALGIVAGVVIYAWKPDARRYGIYLLPPLAGMFAKPTGLIFAPILLAYILLIDRGRLRDSIPAFVLCGAFSFLEKAMTPPSFFQTTIRSFEYVITQPYVTLRYFRSFFLPLYLNVDTELRAFDSLSSGLALAGFAFCGLLVAAAIITARRPEWRAVSFGLWWFLIGLIPTAIFPLSDVENDHRMFLPFIGLSLAVVGTLARFLRIPAARSIPVLPASAAVVVLGFLAWGTYLRNEVWHTDETLWRDDVEKSPNNVRGHYTLGVTLSKLPGRVPDAINEYETALRISPDYAKAYVGLGTALEQLPGRRADAIKEYEAALRISPDFAEAHCDLGNALLKVPERVPVALKEFEAALRTAPDYAEAHAGLGLALAQTPGHFADAILEYETALRIKPDNAEVHTDLGVALVQTGRREDAIKEYEAALRLRPDLAEAHVNLAQVLAKIPDRVPDAIREYDAALRIKPDFAEAHYNLGVLYSRLPGRTSDAIKEYEAAVHINPGFAAAHLNLGTALGQIPGHLEDAAAEFQAAARITPDSAQAHTNLGIVLAQMPGRIPEAISEFEAAFRLSGDPAVRQQIERLRLARTAAR